MVINAVTRMDQLRASNSIIEKSDFSMMLAAAVKGIGHLSPLNFDGCLAAALR